LRGFDPLPQTGSLALLRRFRRRGRLEVFSFLHFSFFAQGAKAYHVLARSNGGLFDFHHRLRAIISGQLLP